MRLLLYVVLWSVGGGVGKCAVTKANTPRHVSQTVSVNCYFSEPVVSNCASKL